MNSQVLGIEQFVFVYMFRSLFIVLLDLEFLLICIDRLCFVKIVVFFFSIVDFENNFIFLYINLNIFIVIIEIY